MASHVVKCPHNGMDKLVLRTPEGAEAELYLYGAHITSWKCGGRDVLFTSKQAIFKPPKAIRGGVPVCFPQFGQLGPLGQHGFARNMAFEVAQSSQDSATLVLKATGQEDPKFPHAFELTIGVKLQGNQLVQELTAINTDDKPMDFTCALHTYFKVAGIDQVRVEGLGGTTYSDSLAGGQKIEQAGDVKFDQEVDRIYVGAPDSAIKIVDGVSGHTVQVHKQGFPDAVVWNPWIAKSQSMADFGDEEYKAMLCIEPALALSGPVTLQPGGTWSGKQVLISS